LLFNHGSAELRLAHHAEKFKLLSISRLEKIRQKQERIAKWVGYFEATRSSGGGGTWAEAMRRRDENILLPDGFLVESEQVKQEVWYRVGYKGYLEREECQIERLNHIEKIRIPPELDYLSVRGLRRESALKLADLKPVTLGQASRISGVNPADISILMVLIGSGRVG